MARAVMPPIFLSDDTASRVVGARNPDGTELVFGSALITKAVVFGDSIGANNWQGPFSATPDLTQNTLSARGYAVACNVLLGFPFRFVYNFGKSGDTTTQMLARVRDVLPYLDAQTIVFVNGGVNDVGQDSGSATIIANMLAICNALTATGAMVSLGTIVPSNYYVTGGSIASRNRALQEANEGFRAIGFSNPRVVVSDDYLALVDSSQTYASYLSANTADNLHPNTQGAMQVGRARAESLASLFTPKQALLGSVSDFKSLVYNPLAVGNNAAGAGGYVQGAGTTGNGPNGWSSFRTGTASGVCSVVARTDEKAGQYARVAVTGGALNNSVGWQWTLGTSGVNWASATAYQTGRVRMPTTPNGFKYVCCVAGTSGGAEPTWPTTVGQTVVDGTVTWACADVPVPGDVIDASFEFSMSGWSGAAIPQAYLTFTGSAYQANGNLVFAGDTPPTYIPPTGRIALPRTLVPSGASNAILNVVVATAAGVTGNFDISRVSARLVNR